MASEIINNASTYSLLLNLNNVFLANSREAIWQLRPVAPSTGAPQASVFILTAPPNGIARRVAMSPQLIAAFEINDQRKINWTRTFSNSTGSWQYMFKYRTVNAPTEYSMILRLAEQYLIRAEARAQLENLDGARSDVNVIRNRAGLPDIASSSKDVLLNDILQERRVEFFGEFGHRWIDLKRSGKIDAALSLVKPQWQSTDALFPIPNSERLLNTNLSQNPGY